MSTPFFNFTISYPGNLLEHSFLDLTVTNSSIFPPGTVLDGWCLDKSIDVSPGSTYTGYVYSAYEPPSISSILPRIAGYVDHLDSVNWLLNYYTDTNPQYNWGEVQAAIWTLMGQDYKTELNYIQDGGAVLDADVNSLVSLALAKDGYHPGLGESIAMIVDTVDANGSHGQPLLVEVKAAALGDRVWNDADADGLQDSGELGIAGAKVELVRDVNGNGAIEANEVLSTTTTDANGNYRFTGLMPGLQYQVRFTQPTGFDGISPRKVDGSSTSGTNSDGLLSDVVVLKAGEYNQTIDAGFHKKTVVPPTTVSLGDRVWLDTNGNGQQDAGEVGVAGVTVKLINAAGTVLATQTTDANGNYLFSQLAPGQYGVEVTKPTGYSFTTANVGADATDSDVNAITGRTSLYTLAAGETNLTVDAGLKANTVPPVNTAALGDRVWYDANGNGQQDSGEAGVAGVSVNLLNAAGTVLATQTTDANGNYLFSNLAAGQYAVEFVKPNGYNLTTQNSGADATDSDADTSTGRTALYTLGAGEKNLTVDAGLFQLAALGDRVWFDTNLNGVQDAGELGKAGVQLQLYKVGADGLAGTADDVYVAGTSTDANGNYLFTGLTADRYTVRVTGVGLNAATEQFTIANAGGNDATDSDLTKIGTNGVSGYTDVVNIALGDENRTVDIGITPLLGSIGDTVWFDTNRNGYQDEAGTGVAGVTVKLLGAGADKVFGTADDTVLATTTTDANGKYLFTRLDKGDYQVEFGNPGVGNTYTVQDYGNNGYDTLDSDANPATGRTGTVSLALGQNRTDVDAGIVDKLGALGDRVWIDTNRNGVQDAGELGKAGVTINLFNVGADGIAGTGDDVYLAQKVTDANGNYLFTDLKAGNYAIKVYNGYGLNAATEQATIPNAGGNDATDSDLSKLDADGVGGYSDVVALAKGQTNLTVDVGIVEKLGSIGDTVWFDTNRNGYQDETGTGVAGINVKLYGAGADKLFGTADDVVLATTNTDANGKYLFSNLQKGDYQVEFGNPGAGNEYTVQDYGNNGYDAADSDANRLTGRTGTITLAVAQNRTDVDAGIVDKLGSLGDRVWIDTNRNGVQDAGEVGKAGVQLQLYKAGADNLAGTADDVYVGVTTTDANGNYLFTNLAAGNYTVKVTGAGLNATTDAFTTANVGDNDGADSDLSQPLANGISGYTDVVALGKGQTNLTVDIGIVQKPASLGDHVWLDSNKNGQQDTGERGVAGVSVALIGAGADNVFGTNDDIVLSTQTTDANGNYLFANLNPGQYQVQFTPPGDLQFTKANIGADATDSDANQTTGRSHVVTLVAGQSDLTVDAGLQTPDPTRPDVVDVCEDRTATFNVLSNDNPGLKLISVTHETAALDSTFQSKAGAISFTADGQVTYKTMTNYYGFDKLIYTVEDAAGNRSTQTVDVTVKAVSDAPTAVGGASYHPGGWEKTYNAGGVTHWVHGYTLSDFGTFSDAADQLQQFGTYNSGVANDVDTLQSVVVT